MTATFTPDYEVSEVESPTNDRRRKITKFALAGVAVLGIGAALTSAAWTDNVWFGGEAETGEMDLVGSLTGEDGSWSDGNINDDGSYELNMGMFSIGPSQDISKTVFVKNDGSVPVLLETIETTVGGALFEGDDPAEVADIADGIELLPGAVHEITVTVSGGDWLEDDYEDASGTVVLHVYGTTDL